MKWLMAVLVWLFLILFFPESELFAGDKLSQKDLMEELRTLKKRVSELEKKLTEYEIRGSKVESELVSHRRHEEHHIEEIGITGGISTFVQGTTHHKKNGHKNDEKGGDADFSFSADIFLERQIGEYGLAHLYLNVGQGDLVARNLPDMVSGPNADLEFNEDLLHMVEAWYQHIFLEKKFVLTVGKMDPFGFFDTNTLANDENKQFFADIFVNNIVAEFGGDDNNFGPGIVATFRPAALVDIALGFFGGEGDFDQVFKHPFGIFEIGFKPKLLGKEGNYRFYLWINDTPHVNLKNPGDGSGKNFGFGLSFDQHLAEGLIGFSRFGIQNKEVSPFDLSWSVGLEVNGSIFHRSNDVLGVAFGMSFPGKEFKNTTQLNDPEEYFEAYYRWGITNFLSISPDIQYIRSPGGDSQKNGLFIFGLRTRVDF